MNFVRILQKTLQLPHELGSIPVTRPKTHIQTTEWHTDDKISSLGNFVLSVFLRILNNFEKEKPLARMKRKGDVIRVT